MMYTASVNVAPLTEWGHDRWCLHVGRNKSNYSPFNERVPVKSVQSGYLIVRQLRFVVTVAKEKEEILGTFVLWENKN